MAQHIVFILFLFAIGASIGSFINVIVWRMPRNESIVSPPSHCPQCKHPLAWRDNLPVIGWLMLGGKCRYCRKRISPRYPIVEFCCGAMFALFYVAVFIVHRGPFIAVYFQNYLVSITPMTDLATDWPIFGLYLFTLAALLAVSLIDAEHYSIPTVIVWLLAAVGILVHTLVDRPNLPGNLMVSAPAMALSAGGAAGVFTSICLLQLGLLPLSFAEGESALEIDRQRPPADSADAPPDYTPAQIRREMLKEALFLLPPLFLALLSLGLEMKAGPVRHFWQGAATQNWFAGLAGSLLGALVGGLLVWGMRIPFSILFGKEAMGLGDIHLLLGIGAVVGAGPTVAIFLLAPFFSIITAMYMFIARRRRQLPFGPYLSMSTAFVMLFYFPIYSFARPGVIGLGFILRQWLK